jgi:outer membrane protein TolC
VLPLDITGELRQLLAAAQAGYRGAAAQRWAVELEQNLAVTRAYYDRLSAKRLREVTDETIALYRRQLADAQARFNAGQVTKNEVLEVDVVLRNAEQRRMREDVAVERTRWAFNEAIGVEVDAPTEVADVQARPDLPSIDDALQEAQQHNPILTQLFEHQRQLDAELSALERSRFPRFEAGGAMDYSTSNLFQPNQIGSGFVGMRWDLGTDTQREERIGAAKLAVDENKVQLESQLRASRTGAARDPAHREERLAALDTATAAIGQAEENLRIRQQLFSVGRAAEQGRARRAAPARRAARRARDRPVRRPDPARGDPAAHRRAVRGDARRRKGVTDRCHAGF